jgi:Domain of unknown function (DUF1902)
MADRKVKVTVAFDREAHVWFVKDSDLHGLNVEGPTIEALIGKLPDAVTDLLEEEGFFLQAGPNADVPIEVTAHAETHARLTALS